MAEEKTTVEQEILGNPHADKSAMIIMHATLKISSALSNIDEMTLEDNFKRKLKQDLLNFSDWFFEYSAAQTKSMMGASETMYIRLIKWLNAYDDNFILRDNLERQTMLFLARCQSAVNDLKTVEEPNFMADYCKPIISRLECIFDKGYIQRLNFIGTNQRGFLDVVKKFDKLFDDHIHTSHLPKN
jgi:hypothetical protein